MFLDRFWVRTVGIWPRDGPQKGPAGPGAFLDHHVAQNSDGVDPKVGPKTLPGRAIYFLIGRIFDEPSARVREQGPSHGWCVAHPLHPFFPLPHSLSPSLASRSSAASPKGTLLHLTKHTRCAPRPFACKIRRAIQSEPKPEKRLPYLDSPVRKDGFVNARVCVCVPEHQDRQCPSLTGQATDSTHY